MKIIHNFPSRIFLLFFFLIFAVRVAPGQSYWVQITNKTGHYIHVIINNKSFLYVAPDDYIRDCFSVREFQVKVFYSPSQAVSGKIERQLYAQGEAQTSCERDVFCDSVPANNAFWEVTVEDFPGIED